jgi:ABC-type branched-subunit amino acid transport system permease subunit
MVRAGFLREHRTWEDWAAIVLGLIIGLTPWFVGGATTELIRLNAVVVGLIVLALGVFELVNLRRWEEVALFACGLWLIVSPMIYGYDVAGSLAPWHVVLGALVVVLAAAQIWQDWSLSRDDLAKHGR